MEKTYAHHLLKKLIETNGQIRHMEALDALFKPPIKSFTGFDIGASVKIICDKGTYGKVGVISELPIDENTKYRIVFEDDWIGYCLASEMVLVDDSEENYCKECGESKCLIYKHTCASGEIWDCTNCHVENQFPEKKEEDY